MKSLTKAIAKLEALFQDRDTRPGVLARQMLGNQKPGDATLFELLRNERPARTRMDGSIGDSLLDTAWAAWEMMDLGLDALDGGLDRLVSWVLGRIEARVPTEGSVPVTLPNGLVLEVSGDAAYATRALAVRTLVRARHGDRPGVAAVVREPAQSQQPPTLNLSASVLGALALAPPEHRHHLDGLVNRLSVAQGADGDREGGPRVVEPAAGDGCVRRPATRGARADRAARVAGRRRGLSRTIFGGLMSTIRLTAFSH